MDDSYLEWMVKQRVAELHATAERLAVLGALRSPRRSLCQVLGTLLMALGRRMVGASDPASTDPAGQTRPA